MKQEQIKVCGDCMAERAALLFKDHADSIMKRLEEQNLETEGDRVQITVPMKMTIMYDQHEYSFEPTLELKKIVKETFSVEPAVYNPLQPDLPGIPEQGASKPKDADVQEEKKADKAISKDNFFKRICGAANEPGPLTIKELEKYFEISSPKKSFDEISKLNIKIFYDIMLSNSARDSFVTLVKETLYPVKKEASKDKAQEKEEKPKDKAKPNVPAKEAAPNRCEVCHPKFPEIRCVLEKGPAGDHKMDICAHKHADNIRVCILTKGHDGYHKYEDLRI
jgi:hypothetical protein